MILKKLRMIGLACIVIMCNVKPVLADITPTYKGYTYDGGGEVVPAPNVYQPVCILDGKSLGCGAFNKPQDLYINEKGDIYILDSGNNRIVILDKDFQVKQIIEQVTKNSEPSPLADAAGIFVNNQGEIVIADKGNARVIVINHEGEILNELTRPDTDLIPETTLFEPIKAIEDKQGNTYVISKNFYQGMIIYDKVGEFSGFFGANKVKGNLKIISDYMYRKIMTKEQKDLMAKYVPTELMSIEIDDNGYLYSTSYASESADVIKRLNPAGGNTLVLDADTVGQLKETRFIDIVVTDTDYMYTLDLERGKVFEFDPYGLNITTFGDLGDQKGLFKEPVAVEYKDDFIYVLDRVKRNITLFKLTEYGEVLHQAIDLYNKGHYEESIEPWKQVLKRNANYNLAYIGLGNAYMNMGEYKRAMEHYKLAENRNLYNEAFKEYRVVVIREHIDSILTILMCFGVVGILLKTNKKYHFIKMFPVIRGGR